MRYARIFLVTLVLTFALLFVGAVTVVGWPV